MYQKSPRDLESSEGNKLPPPGTPSEVFLPVLVAPPCGEACNSQLGFPWFGLTDSFGWSKGNGSRVPRGDLELPNGFSLRPAQIFFCFLFIYTIPLLWPSNQCHLFLALSSSLHCLWTPYMNSTIVWTTSSVLWRLCSFTFSFPATFSLEPTKVALETL